MKTVPDSFQQLQLISVVELTNELYLTLLDQCFTKQACKVQIDLDRQENSSSYTSYPTSTFL